ncbi:MAG TPA: DPP IV N-terminal domain-containing protein [Ignavibacteriaceae bacterium]|nr:DPP IV N-terminal domain-containing protein [Ignavibacteriaceae bacterium]
MQKRIVKILFFILIVQPFIFGQFGKNKVQYKDFTWYYIQTDHFDIYFSQRGANLAEFTSKAAEEALTSLEKSFEYKINNRIIIIIYNSTNDFQETNTTDQYLSEGIEGFTEPFKNRVVIQFMGSFKDFRHLIHHELSHAVINDMFFGGSLQNVIKNRITTNLPGWFNEGMAEYQSVEWDVNEDMFLRDAAISEYLPDIDQLNGYFNYRGGQSVFYYIAQVYGKEKIGELINKIKGTGSVEAGLKASIGLDIEELSKRWKRFMKKMFWPDIAIRKYPDDFAKRLTDPEKGDGFYNTSPVLSPQGDKIAFISNRDYYFDVYIMNAIDGKIIKKLVQGNTTADFEQLNVVTPGLTWSPDGKKIALSAKSDGYDVLYVIDVESEDKETLPIQLDGIKSLSWSPDGRYIAFVGHDAKQSDIYIYDLTGKKLINLTDDVFTDSDPSWTPDGNEIFFASDRKDNLDVTALPDSFKVYNFDYSQTDIYTINVNSEKVNRITDLPNSNEAFPIVSPDSKEILFTSDMSGITNIYRKKISLSSTDTVKSIINLPAEPTTNSLDGISQLSISKDGKKLVFISLYNASFNMFLLTNPFEMQIDSPKVPLTVYMDNLLNKDKNKEVVKKIAKEETPEDTTSNNIFSQIYTGQIVDTTKSKNDSVKVDYSKYVFGNEDYADRDSTDNQDNNRFNLTDNLDKNGNYKVNRYKINFTPDLIYANAGYNTLYGVMGTTVLSFSDVLGNHRLIGVTSLQIDLKNSDYGLTYYYLGSRLNFGVSAFHTARFVFLSRGGGSNLFRFGSYGIAVNFSYPLNRFYRVDAGLSYMNISQENLDNINEPINKGSFIIPSLSFVHDNILWGYISPLDGTRYRFDLLGNPGLIDKKLSFASLLGDYRTYFKFSAEYSFALRLSGGYSVGGNPQRFFLGGVDNWINRKFATQEVPLESISDYAFLSTAIPLRGYEYAQRIGTKYSLLNAEFRFPLIRYFITGALPLFISNIQGVVFFDAGATWNNNNQLQLFERNDVGKVVTKDLLMGTGVGARLYFLYFLLRYDVGWGYNLGSFTKPIHYISIGVDF